jgi:signal transduction histidine kinase
MNLKKLKILFTKNLLIITIIFPLIIILFYGISISFALEYKHKTYTKQELQRYEHELKNKHRNFLKEKARYIESFMEYIYKESNSSQAISTDGILTFIDSIKKYDSGFIFIFNSQGDVIKHPCTETLVNLVHNNRQSTIVDRLIEAADKHRFLYYNGTDCINDKYIKKIAFVHHIKTTDLYIVISRNEKDIIYSINQKKKIWRDKLDDESKENIRLLLILSVISIFLSILFSTMINNLIKDYESEIKDSHKAMFSQARLAQAGELLSMISHQWRQPISKIASISANIRFKQMMGEEIDSDFLDKKLEEIENNTEFLSETIDDFREFYKPKKDKEPEYILVLIDKSLSFLEGQIQKKNISIKKHFAPDVPVLLYPNEFVQVIINILQNAIEFSSNNAFITIETEVKKDEYIIKIKDEAGGIKDECISKIFDAHFSTKDAKDSKNLGLGLYVSKVIIESHFNGKLDVISEGNSATFIIRLVR